MTSHPTTARVAEIETPIGVMVASATDTHLLLLEFSNRRLLGTQLERVSRAIQCVFEPGSGPILDAVRTQLDEYFRAERREFTVPLRTSGTPFQNRVWAELQRIPIGTTTTYAAVARNIGQPTAVRAVAHANGDNRIAIIIPCHRVIGSDGSLTGYGAGLERKQQLLDLEGGSLMLAALATGSR
jgi:AraC family transcriptional regulator of adaptative response/methylated-DNA-[protein]-cysteine methyltransferase